MKMNYRVKKTLCLTMTAAVMAGGLFCGCSADIGKIVGGEETTTSAKATEKPMEASLLVWDGRIDISDEDGGWLPLMCEQFEALHTNWKLDISYGICEPENAVESVLKDVSAAGDVIFFEDDDFDTLVKGGALKAFSKDNYEKEKSVAGEEMCSKFVSNGQLYGIPYSTQTMLIFYDKSAYKRENDDVTTMYGLMQNGRVAFDMTDPDVLSAFFIAAGAVSTNADGKQYIDFNKEGSPAALAVQYLFVLSESDKFLNDVDGMGLAGLRDGSVKVMFGTIEDYQDAQEALGKKLGVAALPIVEIGTVQSRLKSFASVNAIGVNKLTKSSEVSEELAVFLGSTSAQDYHYDMNSVIPVYRSEKNDALTAAQNEAFEISSVMRSDFYFPKGYEEALVTLGKGIVDGSINRDNYLKYLENMPK